VDLKIISGGQTGVDQGALDAAIELGIPHGGTCPKGRKSENGRIPDRFQLLEHPSDKYPPRTRKNIQDADGTLLLVHGTNGLARSRGTKLTLELCRGMRKPVIAANPRRPEHVDQVVSWVLELERKAEGVPGWLPELSQRDRPLVINVAGPRESMAPGIHDETVKFLSMVVSQFS
jgi:hypothetical protein